jgi:hypothetical protein
VWLDFFSFRIVILDTGISRINRYIKPSHASPPWMIEAMLNIQIKPVAPESLGAKLLSDPINVFSPFCSSQVYLHNLYSQNPTSTVLFYIGTIIAIQTETSKREIAR